METSADGGREACGIEWRVDYECSIFQHPAICDLGVTDVCLRLYRSNQAVFPYILGNTYNREPEWISFKTVEPDPLADGIDSREIDARHFGIDYSDRIRSLGIGLRNAPPA